MALDLSMKNFLTLLGKHLCSIIILSVFVLLNSYPIFSQKKVINNPDVLRIKFKPEYAGQLQLKASSAQRSEKGYMLTGIAGIDQLNKALDINGFERVFRHAGKFEKAHAAYGLDLWYQVKLADKSQLDEAISRYKGSAFFEKVEAFKPYRHYKGIRNDEKQNTLTGDPNDPLFENQWHYKNTGQTGGTPGADIQLTEAWAIQTGSSDVTVAIIDGGIDTDHPDLADAMWVNEDEIPGNGIDDDNNGYIDDIYGYGFGDNTGQIFGDLHGTHVGGTVGAVTNNGVGVAGVAGGSGTGDGVRLMSLAGFGNNGIGGFEDAMVYAADNGAVISQNSWGGGPTSIEDAIDYFIARAGLDNTDANFEDDIQIGPMAGGIVIFAAGNDNTDNPSFGYPASYEPVMAVASTDHNDIKSSFSNYGTWVDIAAPGSEVYSTFPTDIGSYDAISGTSMACPHVSGVAALIVSEFGGNGFLPIEVWERLTLTTTDINANNPTFVGLLGSGRLNALNTLHQDDGIAPSPIADLNIAEVSFDAITLTWTATGSSETEGVATTYDLRYSENTIDEANFESAERISDPLRPLPSGQTELFQLTGLSQETKYYFAIKASDYFGNKSGISNIATATTLRPPVIAVTPTSLSEQLFTGGTSVQELTISNRGDSDLTFQVNTGNYVSPNSQSSLVKKDYLLKESRVEPNHELIDGSMRTEGFVLKNTQASLLDLSGVNIAFVNFGNGSYSSIFADLDTRGANVTNVQSPIDATTLSEFSVLLLDDIIEVFSPTEISAIRDWVSQGGALLLMADNQTSMNNVNSLLTGTGIIETGKFSFDFETLTNFAEHTIASGIGSITFSQYGSYCSVSTPAEDIVTNSIGQVVVATSELGLGSILVICDELVDENFSYADDTRLFANQAIDWLASGSNQWLDVSQPVDNTIAPGSSIQVEVSFNAEGLNGGVYTADLSVVNNDPINPVVVVPVTLNVTGAPNISIDKSEVDFGTNIIGGTVDNQLELSNTGTDLLTISHINVDQSFFSLGDINTPLDLAPGESVMVGLSFSPETTGTFTGILTVASNDGDMPSLEIPIIGNGIVSPVSTDSLEVYILPDETISENIVIDNSNNESELTWEMAIYGTANSSLNEVLENLSMGYQSVTNEIPNRYNFSEGILSYNISDGGNDMYDGGNILTTNLGPESFIQYSDKVVTSNPNLGVNGGQYFTAKYPGLFVFAADVGIESFQIDGNLGADGSGNVDEAVLDTYINGIRYVGFVKRVFNAGDPSVNHLVIMEYDASLNHEISLNTNEDYHQINNMGQVERVYYLLYAGSNGFYIDDASTLDIMENFLQAIKGGVSWLTLNEYSGNVPAEQTEENEVVFNAEELELGTYQAFIKVSSNMVNNLEVSIPVVMNVVEKLPNPPIVIAPIADQEIELNGPGFESNLAAVFEDPEGDLLQYSVVSEDESIAEASILGSVLSVTPIELGTTNISITADDRRSIVQTFQFEVSVVRITGVKNGLAQDTYQLNNYPNPFTTSTTFHYNLENSGNVSLYIYDIRGKMISTLVDEYQNSGEHELNVTLSDLNKGLYIYKLHAGENTLIKKMIKE